MDNFIVSARKYRPATFDMVVGQDTITTTLKNAIKNNHLCAGISFLRTSRGGQDNLCQDLCQDNQLL